MANKEISELTVAATLDGTELVHVVQGSNSRQTTTAGVRDLVLIDEDNFASDSAIRAPTQQSVKAYIPSALNASGSAPIFACRAWVNFNGNGTVAIRNSGNVSSITDNGTGVYRVNFATAMPDANYAAVTSAGTGGNNVSNTSAYGGAPATGYVDVSVYDAAGSNTDRAYVSVAVFR